MIHVAAIGEEAAWHQVGSRLVDATLSWCSDFGQLDQLLPTASGLLLIDQGPAAESYLLQWLAARKHVLVSMESWLTSPVLDAASEAAAQSHAAFSIINPTQLLPSRRLIRQRIGEGKLGRTGLVRSHRWEPQSTARFVNANLLPTPLLRDLDVVLSIIGSAPNSVYASKPQREDQRLLSVHLGFADGAMALVDYCDRLPDGDPYQSLSVIGSQGAAYADDQHNQQLMFQGGHPRSVRADEDVRQPAAIAQRFVNQIQSGDGGNESIHGWRRVLAVAESIARSLASGQAVIREGP